MGEGQQSRRVAVVMAGGSGERFWPLSRTTRPKQLLRLTGARESMLAEAVSRLAPLIPRDDIYIATGEHLVEPIREAGVGVRAENVIAEPSKRNTAGCLAYATAYLLAKYRGELPPDSAEAQNALTLAVVTADHLVEGDEEFRAAVQTALAAANGEHALVTIGIEPSRPETGYGYIQIPEDKLALVGYGPPDVYPVTAFHEKPDAATAESFLESGRFYWNSGMFFWNVGVFMRELAEAGPAYASAISEMARAMREGREGRVREVFDALPSAPIDTVLMEKARKVLVVAAPFQWDDIGAWPALARTQSCDARGNLVVGEAVAVDSSGCIIYNESEPGAKEVVVVGAQDLVVVVCDDAVLVVSKERAQDIREAVAEMRRRGSTHL
ncbi:MAG: mannose-1-phosphate guanylyltransferase [Candidatus Hydrogenedentes bacterium]|nr:mannose-1-phosphate guanylyltransferase [Candidatus Hydrogenedentota bacterium]